MAQALLTSRATQSCRSTQSDSEADLGSTLLNYIGLALKHKYLIIVIDCDIYVWRCHRDDADAEDL